MEPVRLDALAAPSVSSARSLTHGAGAGGRQQLQCACPDPQAGSVAHARTPDIIHAALPTGALQLELDEGAAEHTSLIDFAARANPKRAFLFLSKVLGKHYPSRPGEMVSVHGLLAATAPRCDGPAVFIGMAETATGLGQGVFEAWRRSHPEAAGLYLQTTRYRVPGVDWLAFDESHSHAPRLFLHLPQEAAGRATLAAARLLVLVDDELSTGNTFINLVAALRPLMPGLAHVHLATISDFTGRERRSGLSGRMGGPCSIGALLRGAWHFERRDEAAPDTLAASGAAQCAAGHEVCIHDAGYGRLGRTTCVSLPKGLVERLAGEPVEGSTLVLGTGEFMHAAFVLGHALEAHGVDVRVQSTTRSPILLWGAVGHILAVADPYDEGVPNYLYNVRPGQYARVLVCHETVPNDPLMQLAATLGARLIHFTSDDHAEEIPVR